MHDCGADAASLFDSPLFAVGFGDEQMRAVFSARALVQAYLDVESALAAAEADVGLIPRSAADGIAKHAVADQFDLTSIAEKIATTAHPLVPIIRELEALCGDPDGQWVHYGATTQDVTDTGSVLLIRHALDILTELLDRFITTLVRTARAHRDVPMIGRTHGQHALPITLGFKFAVFADEFARHRERLLQLRERALVIQLGGAVGSLAAMSGDGRQVQQQVALRLGLDVPAIAWHSARDRLAEIVTVLGLIASSVAKVANEVITLQFNEIGEVEEPNPPGKVGSSTMPNKRNPMVAENIVSACRLVPPLATVAMAGMVQEHERDMTSWGTEWAMLPDAFIATAGGLRRCEQIIDGLSVNREAMARNLAMTNGIIMAEAFMIRLGPHVGKQRAHDLLYDATMRAHDTGRPMADVIADIAEIAEHLPATEVTALLDPLTYLGECEAFVDAIADQFENAGPTPESSSTPPPIPREEAST